MMSKKKFILLSILKTWFISTVVSIALLILYMYVTKETEVRERPRNCDMSGLAFGLAIFWILFLSILSFSSLFSLLKSFQSTIKKSICWFLLPVFSLIYYFFLFAGVEVNSSVILLLCITNLPWFILWIYYYYRFNTLYSPSL